jgi:N-acetylmuramoyl-L-alanine amidase
MKTAKNLAAAIAILAMAVIVLYKTAHQGHAKMADRKILKKTSAAVDDREYIRLWKERNQEALSEGIAVSHVKQDARKTKPVRLAGKSMQKKETGNTAQPGKNEIKGKMAGDGPGKKRFDVTPAEKRLLAKAVYGEARGESFKGQVAVAAVILNRTEHAAFPDSIRGVIYQKNAFTAVSDGQIQLEPDAKAVRAVEMAIQGEDPTQGAVYYYNPEIATSEWMEKKASNSKKMRIGEHVFFK